MKASQTFKECMSQLRDPNKDYPKRVVTLEESANNLLNECYTLLYNKIEKITSEATLFFNYRENMFLLNRGKLFPFAKRSLQKFYPKQKAFIEEYFANNNIQQDNREEIISFFTQVLLKNR